MKKENKMKMNTKNIIKRLLILIGLFGITPWIINWLVNTPNPFGWGFINDSNKDTWINFFGAIVGGGLTLLGVYITIKKQEEQRRKDLAIEYKPILNCDGYDKEENALGVITFLEFPIKGNINDKVIEQFIDVIKKDENKIKFAIKFNNTGRGCIINLKINEAIFSNPEEFGIKLVSIFGEKHFGNLSIKQNGCFIVSLPGAVPIKKKHIKSNQLNANLTFKGHYTDEFDYKIYSYYLTIPLEVNIIHKSSELSNDNYVMCNLEYSFKDFGFDISEK